MARPRSAPVRAETPSLSRHRRDGPCRAPPIDGNAGERVLLRPHVSGVICCGGRSSGANRRRKLYRTLPYAAVVLIVLYLPIAVPVGMPILQPEAMASYARTLGMTPALQTNTGGTLPLPQDFADMLGWNEMVAEVSRVRSEER